MKRIIKRQYAGVKVTLYKQEDDDLTIEVFKDYDDDGFDEINFEMNKSAAEELAHIILDLLKEQR